MTQHKQLRDNYIAVQVPDILSFEGNDYNTIFTGNGEYEFHSLPYSELPPVKTGLLVKDYIFLFLTSTASEEDCRKVVNKENMSGKFYDYEEKGSIQKYGRYYLYNAKLSFTSLLQSVGIIEGVWAVLEKK